jgi:molecular chaperone DnaJ
MEITLEERPTAEASTRSKLGRSAAFAAAASGAKPGTKVVTKCATATVWCADAPRISAFSKPARSKGTGKLIPEICVSCHGMKTKNNKTLKLVKSPVLMTACVFAQQATVKSGTNGGLPGDLYIEIRLKARFERDGDDLYAAPSALTAAVFGGEIEVPTLALVKQLLISLEGTLQQAAVSACAARASACVPATRATCTAISR